ncbi:MAG: alpha/beta hydrolase [Deltaproteobacteria bacterium]|nr:alpha/beta hydrolase [Deltaproteobacteria bacterium]
MTRLFGGNYLQIGDSRPFPCEPWSLELERIRLTGLQWAGVGTPLLLLHGLANNAWSWARVAGLLRRGHRIIAMSSRGHGRSTPLCEGYALSETVRDTIAVIEQVAGEPVHLAGHSWGGKIACAVAATRPDLVCTLMLADPVPASGLNAVIRGLPILVEAAMRAERGPYPSREAWEKAGPSVAFLQRWDDVDRKLWEASFDEQPDGSFVHRLPESAFDEILRGPIAQDISEMLPAIQCRVLLMRPTFTLSFLPFELRAMRAGLARLEEVRVRGDHTFIHSNPIDTAQAMRTFLGPSASDQP